MIDTVMTVLKWLIGVGVVLWAAMLLLDWIGPTEPVVTEPAFRPETIGPDVEAWLAAQEADVPDLRESAAKTIVWAGAKGARTDLALVYLHGFSASREEVRPLPDMLAERLGANMFYTRLAGHGRDGAAMAEPTVRDWIDDLAEALAVGRRLGDRVVLVGTSTGATLAILAALRPDLGERLAGVVAMSPNLRASGWRGRLIEWPWVRHWAPAIIGAERSWEPHNAAHADHWTERYPTETIATLGALTRYVRGLDPAQADVPGLFLISLSDEVIDTTAAARAAALWGAPSDLVEVSLGPGDDPSGHVLAGDILSPGQTEPLAERITAWIRGL